MDEKNFGTAGPAADRTAGSQCQSEGADRAAAALALSNRTAKLAAGGMDIALAALKKAEAQRDELAAALRSLADFAENHIRLNIKGKHLALAAGQCEELAERARAALAKLDGGK